jgi:hypothetical protein
MEGYNPKKVFTLEEANRTLPLVSRIIGDIVRVNGEVLEAYGRVRALTDEGRQVQAEEKEDQLRDLVHQVQEHCDELEEIGCVCKDPSVGLVDFPARVGRRIVFLCWKTGEPEIHYWHEVEAGFGGRQPVRGAFS